MPAPELPFASLQTALGSHVAGCPACLLKLYPETSLGDLPLVGNLFKNKSNDASKKELVILIKPTVIGADTWQKELERSRELLETWFPDIAHDQ